MIPHFFNNEMITQAEEDITINGTLIPKGYCDATEMCKAGNKRFKDYLRRKQTLGFLMALSEAETPMVVGGADSPTDNHSGFSQSLKFGISSGLLIEVGDAIGGKAGTWVHYKVAINLAAWISPEFEVWATTVLLQVIQGEFVAITPEAQEAQDKLQKLWKELRVSTKDNFWFVTKSIKAYYNDNPRMDRYPSQNYSEVFDAINLGLFGKTSKQLKKELGIGKESLNRDHFGSTALDRINDIQKLTEGFIKQGNNPLQSVKMSLSLLRYQPIDYRS